MRKIVKLMILGFGIVGIFSLESTPVMAQSSCPPKGCWNTITARTGYPAMYCGTCTYLDNSMGSGSTSVCHDCPTVGG